MDMKKLLEAILLLEGKSESMKSAENNPIGPKFGGYWKGTDKGPPKPSQAVGGCEENTETSILKDLKKLSEENSLEWELSEAFANFNEDDLGVDPKRPARTGSRHERGHEPIPEYTTTNETSKPVLKGMYVYNVPVGDERVAQANGLKQTKSGKWAIMLYDTSGNTTTKNKANADIMFGKGHWLEKKNSVTEYGANQPTGTANTQSVGAVVDPEQAKKVAAATTMIKSATGSTAAPEKLAQAISAASQGKSVNSQDMTALQPIMKDLASAASDPNNATKLVQALKSIK